MPRQDYSSSGNSSRPRSPARHSSRRYSDHRSHHRSRSPRRRHPSDSPPPRQYRSRSPPTRRSPPPAPSHPRSPRRRSHSRSTSPPRRKEGKGNNIKGMNGGFKWKEKPAVTPSSTTDEAPKTLDRGYRDQQQQQQQAPKPPQRARSPAKDDLSSKFGADYQTRYDRLPTTTATNNDITSKFGPIPNPAEPPQEEEKKKKKKKKDGSTTKGPKPTSEPMIIVTVNDRLGTKAQIACLASDPIKLFKAMVAAKIGREPHEIKLQRQGERPFKDGLTLEDYGVSNGVQLDLEVDTGD